MKAASKASGSLELIDAGSYWQARFMCFASPCEILIDRCPETEARKLSADAFQEARRIERKFSRYRDRNIVHTINGSHGRSLIVDRETARLLDFADQCFALSSGAFDITSGVLRKFWCFDGRVIDKPAGLIRELLEFVGWDKVSWEAPKLKLRKGMEIDLGGIVKEYAVDSVAQLLQTGRPIAVMVNFGGDIRAIDSYATREPWKVGIENPAMFDSAAGFIELGHGAVATSGDSRYFCYYQGVRYGHIVDPRSGWPVTGAPGSVTVIADNCTAAGFLSTLAILQGPAAGEFLSAQGVRHYCNW